MKTFTSLLSQMLHPNACISCNSTDTRLYLEIHVRELTWRPHHLTFQGTRHPLPNNSKHRSSCSTSTPPTSGPTLLTWRAPIVRPKSGPPSTPNPGPWPGSWPGFCASWDCGLALASPVASIPWILSRTNALNARISSEDTKEGCKKKNYNKKMKKNYSH